MMAESLKLYKLIILYFLRRAKQDITNAILSDFILEYGYTNYFSIQETLAALTEDKMILVRQTKKTSYYTITDKGKETLDFFGSQLPKDTMRQIDEYLTAHKMQIIEDTAIRLDYTKLSAQEYLAKGMLIERGHPVMEAAVSVPSEESAIDACRRFRKKADTIYSFLLKAMTSDDM